MIPPATPSNEAERLAALHAYGILDTPPEETFDRLARIAGALTEAPMVLVSLVDQHRQWFKSAIGLSAQETPRELSFCGHTILEDEVMVVEDAQHDPRFADNPLVIGPPFIRFYAGAPLHTQSNHNVGTLCVIDRRPRELAPSQRRLLADLAMMVVEAMDQRRAQAELLTKSALLRTVVEESHDPIFVKDLDGRYMLLNEACAQAIGHSPKDILGRTDHDLLPAAAVSALREIDHWVTATGRTATAEEQIPTPSGLRTYLSVKSPLIDSGGAIVGVVGIARDITERKQAEVALIRAKDDADQANAAKSEFLSNMSHELRTPLNAVLGFSQMLEMNPAEPLSPTQQKCVKHIHRAGQHLLDLINEIIDLARIESGRVNLTIEDIDANEILDESLSLVQSLAEPLGITLTVNSALGPVQLVKADVTRLTQVLVNLLSNAIKYNRPGGSVTISQTVTANGRLRLAIADTGHGIPPERLDQLFQPFNRLGAESTGIEGTGIGLTITRRLVWLMAGKIGVTSRLGEGSTFWIELPLAAAPPKPH